MLIEKQREHLIAVLGYTGAGLLTLADVKALTTLHQLAGIGLAGYLFVLGLWISYRLPIEPRAARVRRLRDLIRASTFALFLSFGAGFWSGFGMALEAGIRVERAHIEASMLFGAVAASLALLTLIAGVGHIALRDGDDTLEDELFISMSDDPVDP